MTLERLRLLNFQTHEDLKLVLDEHVTTIVGPSDVGKSSVLRALRWVMQNKPSGASFVRNGEDRCRVSLWLDGERILRVKGRGVNEVFVGREKLEAFGADLPESVVELCNVGAVNFQQQHDSPFWFCLTAGQVSRELNAVVNLDVIDRTLAGVAKVLRRTRAAAEVCEDRTREARSEFEGLNWVPEMTGAFAAVETSEESASLASAKVERTRGLLEEVELLKRQAAIEVPDTSELELLRDESIDLSDRAITWRGMLDELEEHRSTALESAEKLRIAEEELEKQSGGICPLCGGLLK